MKLKLVIIGLLASLSCAAQAKNSVTLYGIVDGGLSVSNTSLRYKNSTTKTNAVGFDQGGQNANRWGLKGTERLGNGNTAFFNLENGFNLGSGKATQGGALFGRAALVGIKNKSWGSLSIGRQHNLAFDTTLSFDPFGTSFKQSASQTTFGNFITARLDNSFKYLSPEFAGFQAGLMYSGKMAKEQSYANGIETSNNDAKRSNIVALGLKYHTGPVAAGAFYDRVKDFSKDYVFHNWALGGSYDIKVAKFSLMYGQQLNGVANSFITNPMIDSGRLNKSDVDANGIAWERGTRNQSWLAGIKAPVTEADTVLFSYQGSHIKHSGSTIKTKTSVFSLAYTHELSKRTSLYAFGSYANTKENADNYRYQSTFAAVGVRHRF